jgi:hypothetical protein
MSSLISQRLICQFLPCWPLNVCRARARGCSKGRRRRAARCDSAG